MMSWSVVEKNCLHVSVCFQGGAVLRAAPFNRESYGAPLLWQGGEQRPVIALRWRGVAGLGVIPLMPPMACGQSKLATHSPIWLELVAERRHCATRRNSHLLMLRLNAAKLSIDN